MYVRQNYRFSAIIYEIAVVGGNQPPPAWAVELLHEVRYVSAKVFNATAIGDGVLEKLRNRNGEISPLFPETLADFHLLSSAHVSTLMDFYGLDSPGKAGSLHSLVYF